MLESKWGDRSTGPSLKLSAHDAQPMKLSKVYAALTRSSNRSLVRLQDVQETRKMRVSMLESADLIVLRVVQRQSAADDRVALLQHLRRQASCLIPLSGGATDSILAHVHPVCGTQQSTRGATRRRDNGPRTEINERFPSRPNRARTCRCRPSLTAGSNVKERACAWSSQRWREKTATDDP